MKGGEPKIKIKQRTQTQDCPSNRGNPTLAAALIIAVLSAVAPLYRLRHTNVAAVIAGR